jgi:DNA replication protein DnaC
VSILKTSSEDAARYLRHFIKVEVGDGACFDHVDEVAAWLTDGTKPWLYMSGTPGTGKTTMLTAIRKTLACFARGMETKKFVASDLPVLFTDNYELTVSRLLQGNWCRHLLLDDIGTEPATFKEYGREYAPFAKIVEARYSRRLPMVMTSNLDPSDIFSRYGYRTYDRFSELTKTITFSGQSYRQYNDDQS